MLNTKKKFKARVRKAAESKTRELEHWQSFVARAMKVYLGSQLVALEAGPYGKEIYDVLEMKAAKNERAMLGKRKYGKDEPVYVLSREDLNSGTERAEYLAGHVLGGLLICVEETAKRDGYEKAEETFRLELTNASHNFSNKGHNAVLKLMIFLILKEVEIKEMEKVVL